ncbi:hypothetical protein QA600_22695 [Natronococcus sp. A-GB1]|uniref:HalOD1 output domain-containing protein n=1 Tax=Natronococcus sp. A-GB1 TaxID=3037648 RepID=UPI00241E9782|nr:HalOD1 output domain-containing protein [Natronococcus sp. A-GB1]MDG5762126.1 hypothetical protein [Natronococcus sp. A-GB1]
MESIQGQYDWSTRNPSTVVVNAIAVLENVEPCDLSSPLNDYINPDALDEVVSGDSRVVVSFVVDGYRVRVDGDGVVITDD